MSLNFRGSRPVTGAGGGLGRAHALALARRGAAVVVNDLGTDLAGSGSGGSSAEAVAAEIEADGGTSVANADSVSDPAGADRMVATALSAFGRLDIVVNNAGVLDEIPLAQSTAVHAQRVIDTHLLGTMNVLRAAWPHLVGHTRGESSTRRRVPSSAASPVRPTRLPRRGSLP